MRSTEENKPHDERRKLNHLLCFPIVEIRDDTFYVLNEYYGVVEDGRITTRFNLRRNMTRYVIDSGGTVLELNYLGNNKNALRALVGILWNIANDYYSYTVDTTKDVSWFRQIVTEFIDHWNPDIAESAQVLMGLSEPFPGEVPLKKIMGALNL